MNTNPGSFSGDRMERDVQDAARRYYRYDTRGNSPAEGRPSGLTRPGLEASAAARDRRRSALLEEAEREKIPGPIAELLYDIALDEGLDPPIALELVRIGLSVSSTPESESTEAPVVDKYLPPWVFPGEDDEAAVRRERTLRNSFRRLRAFLESEDDVEAAMRRFADEPDVGYHGY